MRKTEYLDRAFELYNSGKISADVYDAMIMNADIFCDDEGDERDERLPEYYAEIEYEDMDTAEAYEGSRWDDMNYTRYMER